MRKAQKQQIEETIRQMEEAHNEMKRCIEQKNAVQAQELLADCQNAAIAIGTLIEDTEGEGHPAVTALEDYCEQVYRIHESLATEGINANKIYKALRQKLIKTENSIRNDVKIRKVAVFLPYKASMWDSLESVWKAADADPDCDAYVIPIPYFDRNPDGSFKEEHYEGDQYPDYVPITCYDEYDLEAVHPDVIYIHNPYDECNYVTSVHPHFYSKNLRNYTDKLVYIPYFILGEIEPDNQAAIDGMKHFCFLPGTIYAHQVIVQSENMRQIYINEYIMAAKQAGLGGEYVDRKFLEKKFLGTGSPKIDKVLNTKKENLEIPEEWLKIIEKPDGSWKKIVFYNTSVGALLQHSEKMLAKMESVFGIFKEHKDEVALLWRPHPLIRATIESMRPQLWEKYREIKDRYIEEGWGIYDDTSDVDRAVVLSDAYYGDGSSVAELCQKAKMPVMLQNVEILGASRSETNNHMSILITDAAIANGKIWSIAHDFNGLFVMDIKTGNNKLAGIFPDEPVGAIRLYETMKIVDEKIYFAPFYAKSIAVFDIRKNQFSNIPLDENQIGCALALPLFGGMERYGQNIYMMPIYSKAIVCLDTDSGKMTYITGWVRDVACAVFNEKDAYFRRQTVLVANKIMAPFCNANAVLELDCETKEYKIHKLGLEKRGYSGICFDGRSYWLTPRAAGNLVRWDVEINATESVLLCRDEEKGRSYAYAGIIYSNRNFFVFPTFESEIKARDRNVCVTVLKGKYVFAKQEDDIVSSYDIDSGTLIIKNMKTNQYKKTEIDIDCKNINLKTLMKGNRILLNETKYLNERILIWLLKSN